MIIAIALSLALLALPASAHQPSDAELRLRGQDGQAVLQLSVPLQDLAAVLPLDADRDRQLRWSELQAAGPIIGRYLGERLELQLDGRRCAPRLQDIQMLDYHGRPAGWFMLTTGCTWPAAHVRLDYRLLFDWNPTHRGVLLIQDGDGAIHSRIAAPGDARWSWRPGDDRAAVTLWNYLLSGIHHIWIGLDHLLFVLVLLLPTAVTAGHRPARPTQALKRTAWLVTAFTAAHSLTLAGTVLDYLQAPGAWIELAIAASIALAALNNIFGWVTRRHALFAFAFGLLHGFGFASVLQAYGLPQDTLLFALLGFNLGVEVGQLALVCAALPLLVLLAHRTPYRALVLQTGSAAAVVLASGWMLQRGLPLIGGAGP